MRRSDRPLTFTLLQNHRHPEQWRNLLDRVSAANAEGLPIHAQVRGRPTSALLGFELSEHPFFDCPSWRELAPRALADRVAILRDSDFRTHLLAEARGAGGRDRRLRDWDDLYVLGDPAEYEPDPSTSLDAEARRHGITPAELAYELMLHDDGRGILYHPMTN